MALVASAPIVGCLPIRRDDSLQLAPELVHRIELRRLLRQPDQANAERVGHELRLAVRMRARAIGEQPDRGRMTVVTPQLEQERQRVRARPLRPRQHHAMPGAAMNRAKEFRARLCSQSSSSHRTENCSATAPWNSAPFGARRRLELRAVRHFAPYNIQAPDARRSTRAATSTSVQPRPSAR